MNDLPVAGQSRRTDRSIFSAEKMQEREVQILLACGLGHRTALKCQRALYSPPYGRSALLHYLRNQTKQSTVRKANSHKDVLCIRLSLPIESANKNTQNSEMNSACFCLHFSSLKNGRKNGIIYSERIRTFYAIRQRNAGCASGIL